jgi:hypothetical protein
MEGDKVGLTINQSYARIGINKTDAFININHENPKIIVSSTLPSIQIDTEIVKVEIDQTRPFNEIGLKNIDSFLRDMAKKAMAHSLDAIDEIAKEGDLLARIESNKNAIPRLAAKILDNNKDLNVVAAPSSRPVIHFAGKTNISSKKGKVDIGSYYQPPRIAATRNSIDIYLDQKAFIDIEYHKNKVDKSL